MKTNKNRGNVKEQRKRRKKRMRHLPEWKPDLYQLIDNNLTHYPAGYCKRYQGWLSIGLLETHGCLERGCVRYEADTDQPS